MKKPFRSTNWRHVKIYTDHEVWCDDDDGTFEIEGIVCTCELEDEAIAISVVPDMIDALITAREIINELLKESHWTKDKYYEDDISEIEQTLTKAGVEL